MKPLLAKFYFFSVLTILICAAVGNVQQQQLGYEVAKHSFHAPFLFGISSTIPHWDYGGAAIATEHFVRLTPVVKSRVGWLWNTDPVESRNWEVVFQVNIHNSEAVGADGVGFWYSKEIKKEGTLLGQAADFEGFGVLLDSYDNNLDGEEPAIKLIRGTGQKTAWDYGNDLKPNALAKCTYNFRNMGQGRYLTVKVLYNKETLTVSYDGVGGGEFQECFTYNNLNVPPGYFLGLTAATGGLADYHDVFGLTFKNLDVGAEPESPSAHGWWDPHEFYRQDAEKKGDANQPQAIPNPPTPQSQTAPVNPPPVTHDLHRHHPHRRHNPRHRPDPSPKPPPPSTDAGSSEMLMQEFKRKYEEEKRKLELENNRLEEERRARSEEQKRMATETDLEQHKIFENIKEKLESLGLSDKASQEKTDAITKHTGVLILDALEQVSKSLQVSSTKSDIVELQKRVYEASEQSKQLTDEVRKMKSTIEVVVGANSGGLSSSVSIDTMKSNLNSIDHASKQMQEQLRTLGSKQEEIMNNIQRFQQSLKDVVGRMDSITVGSGGGGAGGGMTMWVFILLFQVVFAAAYYFHQKFKDVRTSKVF